MDEATSENLQKVLTILVSYYSEVFKQVVVDHLDSVTVIKCDSVNIFAAVVGIFTKNKLPWKHLMSALMDSCNVMRGSKNGVEARLREQAPHMLDIDGDTCHHAHNAAKSLTKTLSMKLNLW